MRSSDNPSRKATSFDVARQAGVSRATVSRTFTPNASVSPETREKVHKAAKELGYRVNYLARSLINRRSDLVGIVVAGMDNPFRAQQVHEIAKALVSRNFRPILLPADQGESADHVMDQLLHYNVSGVLVTSDAPPTELCREFAVHGIPIVLINKGDPIPLVDRVISDNATAGRVAAETLVECGAKQLAVLSASHVSYAARHREAAFVARGMDLGCAPRVVPVLINDYQNGLAAGRDLDGIDGLFCINDYMACGVIDALRTKPQDPKNRIRLIGHDDIGQAAWQAYGLTTFRQPCDIQASQAIDLLISRMADPELEERTVLTPVTLVRRVTA
ncbi:LacI family transcriptional regulator [Phyllobacterium brassicacearum]|uniref:LacI family transcriptional regulator n=1 Tax=Phyllobacterium brassicacearum TaxID=314235 RepID=A0A2P7B916_9HYPH|nr:LacI family DNA-binding transcriptional regulator [Phyllobacterium brassicacearum]PSH62948.1 LacI family transcriptional regulator [Phyllobacterium brassicacearum]TDQ13630.1 LacI family transcriptional regulator [Phyllobacterium brassicacearum]